MLKNEAEINLECVEGILRCDYGSKMTIMEKEAFKVAFVLCADAYFLGPKGAKPRINPEMYRNLAKPALIGEFNWCAYELHSLVQGSQKVKDSIAYGSKTVTLYGCLLFAVLTGKTVNISL